MAFLDKIKSAAKTKYEEYKVQAAKDSEERKRYAEQERTLRRQQRLDEIRAEGERRVKDIQTRPAQPRASGVSLSTAGRSATLGTMSGQYSQGPSPLSMFGGGFGGGSGSSGPRGQAPYNPLSQFGTGGIGGSPRQQAPRRISRRRRPVKRKRYYYR